MSDIVMTSRQALEYLLTHTVLRCEVRQQRDCSAVMFCSAKGSSSQAALSLGKRVPSSVERSAASPQRVRKTSTTGRR